MARIDLTGKTFGELTVLAFDQIDKNRNARWFVRCDCGKTYSAYGRDLRNGHTTQCTACGHVKHGHAKDGHRTPLHEWWHNIKARCYNSANKDFDQYGQRGIGMAALWREDFAAFAVYVESVLGTRPKGCSLDRIDNDRGYLPGNLRWATPTEQSSNTSRNVWVSFGGQRMILEEFSRLIGKSPSGVGRQLRRGWSAEFIAERGDSRLILLIYPLRPDILIAILWPQGHAV
jgi:hypothetical protein